MNKILLKLSSVTLILLLLTTNSFAENEKKKDIIKTEKSDEGGRNVDDADRKEHEESLIKGGDKVKDKLKQEQIKLSDIKNNIPIERSGLNYPPYRCFIYRHGKEIDIGTTQETSFTFTIDKSLLKVGDEILITNRLDSTGSISKKIIHDIEIIK